MPKLMSLVSVLWIAALSIACGAEKRTAEAESTLQRAAEQAPQYLSDLHHDKKVFCQDCHGQLPKPNDSETQENAACVHCHSYEKLVADDNRLISPHRSHLGRINCTTCHHNHTGSQVYCANCHIFDMQIPFEGNPTFAVPNNDEKPKVEASADVVVIGSGGAGLSAAITSHDLGRSVIVLEKQPFTGGNTMLSAGGMNAANTRFQQALGIQDSVQSMVNDTLAGGGGLSDTDLVAILATNSASSVEWLTSLGVDLSDVGKLAGASVKRAHRPKGGKAIGAHLIDVLRRNVAERGIDVRVNSKVVKIVEDDAGRVVGVHVQGRHSQYAIEAKAIVLAAGGFSANPERVAYYCSTCAGMITSNQPGATGDGLDLGVAINGELVQMEQIQIHPTLAAGSRILITEAVRGNGGVLVNREGLRFVNEMATRAVVSGEVLKQTGRTAFVVFESGIRGTLAQIEGYVRLGLVKQANTLEQLAVTLGMPEGNLISTIDRYNRAFAQDPNCDPDFCRQIPRPLDVPPYYAIEIAPGIHYTMGGLRIDTQARVISTRGTPIAGFFAAGEVTGGIHGKDRLGGNSISETITFGRIAGANASTWAGGQSD